MTPEEKRKLVLEFMRESASKGGLARAKNNSKAKLSQIGKDAAAKRWAKKS